MKTLRSPLNKARGLGSNKTGSEHFLRQRFLIVLLVPLIMWFFNEIITLVFFAEHDVILAYFQDVCAVTLAVVLLSAVFYHGALGVKNICEDYIHCETTKHLIVYFIKAVCLFTAMSGIIAVLSISLKG